MAATLTSSLPLSVISAFLSPVQRWSRHGLITIGCSLGMTLLGSEVVVAQPMDLPAVARCQMEVASQPNREALIRNWIHRAGQTDALAALCLSFSPNPNAGESLAWLRRAADLGLPDAQLLLGADLEVGFKSPPNSQEAMRWYRKAAQADFPFMSSVQFIRKAGPTNGKTCLKPTTGRRLRPGINSDRPRNSQIRSAHSSHMMSAHASMPASRNGSASSRSLSCPKSIRTYCGSMRPLASSLRQIISNIIRYLLGGASASRLTHDEGRAQQARADLAMLQILVQESERPHTDGSLSGSPVEDDPHP